MGDEDDKLSAEDQAELALLEKLLKERKPRPGHKISSPGKFSGQLTPPVKRRDERDDEE